MHVNNDFFDRERETVSSVQTVLADRVDILSCRRYLYYHFSVLSFSRKKLVFFSRCSTRDSTAEYIIVHIPEQARYMDVPFIVTALIQTMIFYFFFHVYFREQIFGVIITLWSKGHHG